MAERSAGIAKFQLDPSRKTLLVFGGRGARSINQSMIAVEKALAGDRHIQILHATGQQGYQSHIEALGENLLKADNLHIVPYLHDMPLAWRLRT